MKILYKTIISVVFFLCSFVAASREFIPIVGGGIKKDETNSLQVSVALDNESDGWLTLSLLRLNDLISPEAVHTYVEYDKKSGIVSSIVEPFTDEERNCYYSAEFENGNGIFRLCNGLEGSIQLNGNLYIIEPLNKISTIYDPHIITLQSSSDIPEFHISNPPIFEPPPIQKRETTPANVYYVEVSIFNDVARYTAKLNNTQSSALAIFARAASLYIPNLQAVPQIRLVLSSMTTFTTSDPWPIYTNCSGVCVDFLLSDFNNWVSKNANNTDYPALFSGLDFKDSIVGYNGLYTMCKRGGIYQTEPYSTNYGGLTMAHEIGHGFGLSHDGVGNGCPNSGYIMQAVGCSNCPVLASQFSSCSWDVLKQYAPTYSCLYNVPTSAFLNNTCGNGIVEQGEECDCGALCHLDPCCDNNTCTLYTSPPSGQNATYYPAVCSALDACCQNCQIIPYSQQQICRNSSGPCDATETCNGFSSTCPDNRYADPGTACNGTGTCLQGQCVSYLSTCKAKNYSFTCDQQTMLNNGSFCGDLYCGTNASVCTSSLGVSMSNGVSCGNDSYCYSGTCTNVTLLKNYLYNYSWKVSAWADCNATCQGIQSRNVYCVDNGTNIVDDSNCQDTKPDSIQVCNICYRWVAGAWGVCSVTCGNGTMVRSVACLDLSNQTVNNSLCDAATKPSTVASCNLVSCYRWVAGAWSACSVTCGDGISARGVTCLNQMNQVVNESLCDAGTKPAMFGTCNLGSCYRWFAGNWNNCSVTCGNGTSMRDVYCFNQQNQMVNESLCNATTKLSTIGSCDLGSCYKWVTGAWSVCSVTCGDGISARSVICADQSKSNQRVNDSLCDSATKPTMFQTCNLGSCFRWFPGSWSACSVTCGNGTSIRDVKCLDQTNQMVNESLCNATTKPSTIETCNLGTCYRWFAGGWSECSVTCGDGISTRGVACLDQSNQNVNESLCDAASKPATLMSCDLGSCYRWVSGNWSACSAACGNGTSFRDVKCFDQLNQNVNDSMCNATTKPATKQPCFGSPCDALYNWTVSAWSDCVCEVGMRFRNVNCTSSETESDVDDDYCQFIEDKPEQEQKCEVLDACVVGLASRTCFEIMSLFLIVMYIML